MMIIHDKEQHMFRIEKEEGVSYIEYALEGRTMTVLHTVVPKALSGQGLAGKLAEAAYAWAKEENLTLLSDCSYMTHWLEKK